jgi:hypothetical protein
MESLGKQQLEGAVALHNMLARQGIAYLADEVGMGKTYIALGVVALMRRLNPVCACFICYRRPMYVTSGAKTIAVSSQKIIAPKTCG